MPASQAPLSATAIDAWLRKKGSPLAGLGSSFVQSGSRYGVDPRLLVSISGAESSYGTYGPSQKIHNPFGMGPGINYQSYQAAIDAAAKNLGQNYIGKGLDTIPEIQQKWAPSGANNDPTGLNNNWVKNVSAAYESLGGDPGMTAEIASYITDAAQMEQQYAHLDDATSSQQPQQQALPFLGDAIAAGNQRPQLSAIRPLGELSQRVSDTPIRRTPRDQGSNAIVAAKLGELIRQQIGEQAAKAGMTLQIDHDHPISPNAPSVVAAAADYNKSLIGQAKSFLGTPYKWGGESPKTGFDCSGFAQWLYKQQGVDLPRVTYDQIKVGKGVGINSLEPGDLVFFGTKKNPHHEGIYIGAGQFIHAPHTGDVIKISSLTDGYYRNNFVTGRRVR